MLIKGFNGLVGLKSGRVLQESKVVEAIFVSFKTEFFDFTVFLKESFDLVFNLWFSVFSVEVSKENLVAVGILSGPWLLFLTGRRAFFPLDRHRFGC